MDSQFQVWVFGKEGCQKCKVLNERVDKLLSEEEWQDFEKKYLSLDTEEGIVAFSEAECINPQRIPAMLVARQDEETGSYMLVPTRNPGGKDDICRKSKLYQYLGIQTDYEQGGGVINPKMIKAILSEARV